MELITLAQLAMQFKQQLNSFPVDDYIRHDLAYYKDSIVQALTYAICNIYSHCKHLVSLNLASKSKQLCTLAVMSNVCYFMKDINDPTFDNVSEHLVGVFLKQMYSSVELLQCIEFLISSHFQFQDRLLPFLDRALKYLKVDPNHNGYLLIIEALNILRAIAYNVQKPLNQMIPAQIIISQLEYYAKDRKVQVQLAAKQALAEWMRLLNNEEVTVYVSQVNPLVKVQFVNVPYLQYIKRGTPIQKQLLRSTSKQAQKTIRPLAQIKGETFLKRGRPTLVKYLSGNEAKPTSSSSQDLRKQISQDRINSARKEKFSGVSEEEENKRRDHAILMGTIRSPELKNQENQEQQRKDQKYQPKNEEHQQNLDEFEPKVEIFEQQLEKSDQEIPQDGLQENQQQKQNFVLENHRNQVPDNNNQTEENQNYNQTGINSTDNYSNQPANISIFPQQNPDQPISSPIIPDSKSNILKSNADTYEDLSNILDNLQENVNSENISNRNQSQIIILNAAEKQNEQKEIFNINSEDNPTIQQQNIQSEIVQPEQVLPEQYPLTHNLVNNLEQDYTIEEQLSQAPPQERLLLNDRSHVSMNLSKSNFEDSLEMGDRYQRVEERKAFSSSVVRNDQEIVFSENVEDGGVPQLLMCKAQIVPTGEEELTRFRQELNNRVFNDISRNNKVCKDQNEIGVTGLVVNSASNQILLLNQELVEEEKYEEKELKQQQQEELEFQKQQQQQQQQQQEQEKLEKQKQQQQKQQQEQRSNKTQDSEYKQILQSNRGSSQQQKPQALEEVTSNSMQEEDEQQQQATVTSKQKLQLNFPQQLIDKDCQADTTSRNLNTVNTQTEVRIRKIKVQPQAQPAKKREQFEYYKEALEQIEKGETNGAYTTVLDNCRYEY